MNKKNIINFILLVAVLTVVSGCTDKTPINNQSVVDSEDEQNVVDVATSTDGLVDEVDNSDWQTYRNDEYGLKLSYPKGWEIEVDNSNYKDRYLSINIFNKFGNGNFVNKALLTITIFDSNGLSLSEWMNDFIATPPGYTVLSKEKTLINGIEGEYYDMDGVLGLKMKIFEKDNKIYSFSKIITVEDEFLYISESMSAEMDSIIESFNFY